jgi:S-adenosylmethionine/arginine decarboxylase-like enzyme
MIVRNVQFNPEVSWGLSSSVDVKNCDPQIIRHAELIRDYVIKLCDLIDMKRFGDCQVVHFGEDEKVAGFSMVQLIETSLISGHFANATNSAYIDIFSCKAYDPAVVAEFTKEYFKGDSVSLVTTDRV